MMMLLISSYRIYLLPLLDKEKEADRIQFNQQKKTKFKAHFSIENILATALALRETVARPSLSSSLPRKHAYMQFHAFFFLLYSHTLSR
jgi:hypothetical protein